jgi:hypothetical protein
MTFSEGIRVPGWAVGAVLAAMGILGVGYSLGAQESRSDSRLTAVESQIQGVDFRLCRIERQLSIAPYQSCGTP